MYLVYTNSMDRAIRMACCLDGVILSDRTKVRADTVDQYYAQLVRETQESGSVRCYFRGMLYVFVFSEGAISAPAKMVDYDKKYAKIENRPTPFFPTPFISRPMDSWFQTHREDYWGLLDKADQLINAASDDYEGELAFSQFEAAHAQDVGAIRIRIMRARPRMITEECVREAFNATEDPVGRSALVTCYQCRERLDWLVACNATNVLSSEVPGKVYPIGRTEAVLLALVSNRCKEVETPGACLKCEVSTLDGKPLSLTLCGHLTMTEAQEIAAGLPKTGLVVKASNRTSTMRRPRLFDIFTLQAEMWETHRLPPRDVLAACERLYNEGYISWPCGSSNAPWAMKGVLSQAMQSLGESKFLQDPRRVTQAANDFMAWDSAEHRWKRWGVVVTGQPPAAGMPADMRSIYQAIVESNIRFLTKREREVGLTLAFDLGGKSLIHSQRRKILSEADGADMTTMSGKEYPEGTVFCVDEARAERASAAPYTPWELLSDAHSLAEGSLQDSASYLASALDNLASWGYVKPLDGDSVQITERGMDMYRRLEPTGLSDVSGILSWDGRLQALADKQVLPFSVRDDMPVYIEDLCQDLRMSCQELQAADGRTLSDCVCPHCHSAVVAEPSGDWKCSSCKWKVPASFKGHDLTTADIVNLLAAGRTRCINDFQSAKGPYTGYIVMENGVLKLSFDPGLTCPVCGKPLALYRWNFKCQDAECGFALERSLCGHTWTDSEIKTLMSGGATVPIHFVSKAKKEFYATAQLDADKKIQLIYV